MDKRKFHVFMLLGITSEDSCGELEKKSVGDVSQTISSCIGLHNLIVTGLITETTTHST